MSNKLPKIIYSIACCATIQPVSTHAESANTLNESDFFSDLPVVLTATRLKQAQKDAPIATSVITREMIEASGFTRIVDLLRLAPGMIVKYSSGNTAAAGYTFLFDKYTVRMQILIDGRSVYTPIFGEMNWNSLGISVDDIDRIEVIRGPSSSSYGPNAMTGVVSIITRHPSLESGTYVRLTKGENGVNESHIHVSKNIKDFAYRISATKNEDNGFNERYDNSDINTFNLQGNYQATNNDELVISAIYDSGKFGEVDLFSPVFHPPHTRKIINKATQVKWIHTVSDQNSFTLNAYQQEHDDLNAYPAVFVIPPFTIPLINNENIYTLRNNAEFSQLIEGKNYSLTWGLTYRSDKTIAPLYLYNLDNNKVTTKQFFMNATYIINDNDKINIGYLVDDNDIANKTHSPRISLNHDTEKNGSFRLSYATSTRSPFIFEERTNFFYKDINDYFNSLGISGIGYAGIDQVDLEAEKIESIDIGWFAKYNQNKTTIDARVFKNKLSNLVYVEYVDVIPDIFSLDDPYFNNGEEFNIEGAEITFGQKFDSAWYTLNIAKNKITPIKSIEYNPDVLINSTPPYIYSLITEYNFNDSTSLNLNFYGYGKMKQISNERLQNSRKRIDLQLAKRFKFNNNPGSISLKINNITNEKYIETIRPPSLQSHENNEINTQLTIDIQF